MKSVEEEVEDVGASLGPAGDSGALSGSHSQGDWYKTGWEKPSRRGESGKYVLILVLEKDLKTR